jgi:hypothetical protein
MSETSRVPAEERVSDTERDRVISDLTRHCGDGRLTLDELEERVAEAYAAMTKAELAHVMRELPRAFVPVPHVSALPEVKRSAAPVRTTAKRGAEIALKVHLYVYLSVIAFLVLIYTLTDFGGYFWPIWPAAGWGVAVAIQAGVTKAID